MTRHKIGSTRTIATAVLVVQWLRDNTPLRYKGSKDAIRYSITECNSNNGFWSADIIIEGDLESFDVSSEFVQTCRAFVAGRGEIW